VIDNGRLVVIEEKMALMRRLGQKQLRVTLARSLAAVPPALAGLGVSLAEDMRTLSLTYAAGPGGDGPAVAAMLKGIAEAHLQVVDISTRESSLEDIFVNLVGGAA